MNDSLPHRKSDENAEWWMSQLERAEDLCAEVEGQHYRRQLQRLTDLRPDSMVGYVSSYEKDEPGAVERVDVLYIPRYIKWVESQAFDFHPEIRYPRYATPDTQYGDMIGELLVRVGDECDEILQWRGTIADAATWGVFSVWYGIHDEAVSYEMLHDAMKPVGQVVAEGAQGAIQPRDGQDHAMISRIAMDQALGGEDPESQTAAKVGVLSPGGEDRQAALLATAEAHMTQAERDAKRAREWRVAQQKVWCQRRPVGPGGTMWDPTVDDIADARWISRDFTLDIDVARKHPAFKPTVASRLEPSVINDIRKTENISDPAKAEPIKSNRVLIREIWDRKYNERHYITRGIDVFLERDAKDPYADEMGRPTIKGFAPVVICAPDKTCTYNKYRPFGKPTTAIAYPLQRLMIQLFSHNLDAVKKLSVRQWLYDPQIDESELEKLQSGMTGVGIKRPDAVTDGKRDAVEPINYGTVPREMFEQFMAAKNEFATLLAWPVSQMTGLPQADTATAEQISVTAGHSQLGDFIRSLEDAYARGQEIKRSLIKRWYSDAQIEALMGPESIKGWREWKASPVDGDRMEAVFEPRIRGEDATRRKQIGDVLMMAMQMTYPGTTLPRYETDHLMQEWARLHGVGKLMEKKYSDEQLALEAQRMIVAAGGGEASSNGKASGGNDARSRNQNPASNQQRSAAEQRAGPPRGGPGRGMSPGL